MPSLTLFWAAELPQVPPARAPASRASKPQAQRPLKINNHKLNSRYGLWLAEQEGIGPLQGDGRHGAGSTWADRAAEA